MVLNGLTDGGEDNAFLSQLLLERRLHRYRVHDRIDSRAAESEPLLERNAELIESLLQLWVDLLVLRFLSQRVGIVGYCLEIDVRNVDVSPCGNGESLPVAVSLQTEVEEPVGLSLLLGDKPHDILVESFRDDLGLYVGGETILIFLVYHLLYKLIILVVVILHITISVF